MNVVDMSDERLMRDPFGGYSRIRERAPLVRAVLPGVAPVWVVTRYDDVRMVLSDPRFVSDPANVPGTAVPNLNEQVLRSHHIPAEYVKYRLARMSLLDGADHARLRRLVAPAFTVRAVARRRPRVARITAALLDGLPAGEVVDLHGDFAYPLSSTVICELVGIPERDRARWLGWYGVVSPAPDEGKAAAWRAMVAYLHELVERRRAKPADDLVSELVRAGGLSDTEMIAMIVNLGLTGHQNTAHLISNGVLALLTHPGQLALLRATPGLLPGAVHELLRWCGPVQLAHIRYATEDLEIGGMPVRRGEAVRPVLVAANHDPRRFADPARLDITRAPDVHVAFSHGTHHCVGAPLARLETELALGALLRRFPGLALAVDPRDLPYEPIPFLWHPAALPVRLGGGSS